MSQDQADGSPELTAEVNAPVHEMGVDQQLPAVDESKTVAEDGQVDQTNSTLLRASAKFDELAADSRTMSQV